jgi:hypothetical protein
MANRSDSDERYVLNLCDELLGLEAQRQYAHLISCAAMLDIVCA